MQQKQCLASERKGPAAAAANEVDGARIIMEQQKLLPPQKGDVAVVAPTPMRNCSTGYTGYRLVIPDYTEGSSGYID